MGRHRPTPRSPETPPNLTWPEHTEPPRADDGQASPNQLKLNDTDKIGVQNAGRQSRGITGGRQRFGAFQVVPVDRRHARSPNRQTLDAALVVEVDAGVLSESGVDLSPQLCNQLIRQARAGLKSQDLTAPAIDHVKYVSLLGVEVGHPIVGLPPSEWEDSPEYGGELLVGHLPEPECLS
jgi:hypothetical protein